VCNAAQELAVQAGIQDFRASRGWYSGFIRRFGYTEADDSHCRKLDMEGQGGIKPMPAMGQRVVPAMQVLVPVHFSVKLRVIPRGSTEIAAKHMTLRLDVAHEAKPSRGYDMLLATIRIQFGELLGLDPRGALGGLPGCRISFRVEGGGEYLISSARDLTAVLDMPRPRTASHDGVLLTVSAF
jgi:hypothetical protein